MKPRTIVIIAVAAILVICFAIYFFVNNGGSAAGRADEQSPASSEEQVVPASQAIPDAPTGSTITIGTKNGSVTVANFYLSNPSVTDGGETVILASTSDYLDTYDTIDSSFWVGVDPSQFSSARSQAEQALLSALGVSQTDACKLDVTVGVFYSATSSMNGQSFPLSFCPSSASGGAQ